MLPVFFIILIIFRRQAFKEKFFYLGIAALLLLISPLIIYNFMTLQTRGHFDAALSSMLGQSPEDFKILKRETNKNLNIFPAVKNILSDNFSPGFQILIVSGLILFSYKICRESGRREAYAAVLLGFLFSSIALSLVGGGDNFGVIILPFTAILIGGLVFWLRQKFPQRWQKNILMALAIIAIIAVAFVSALASAAKATSIDKERTMAESLARSELEYIKNSTYSSSYDVDSSITMPSGWTIDPPVVSSVPARGSGIQQVVVSVIRNGREIISLTDYKVNRP